MFRGYTFYRHRAAGSKTRWFCATNHNKGCRATVYTVQDVIVSFNNEHNHLPSKKFFSEIVRSDGSVYTRTIRGTLAVVYDGYTFSRHRVTGDKTRWHCTTFRRTRTVLHKIQKRCTFDSVGWLQVLPGPVFMKTKRGRGLIMLDGYKFYRHSGTGVKSRWRCSTNYKGGCNATLVTIEDELFQVKNIHNHPLPFFTKSSRGGDMILLEGYTFCRHSMSLGMKQRWRCSVASSKGCKASLITFKGLFQKINNNHNHD
ncbi:unnamed protein product [Chrysodeixis includens]|uniref:FLYWCH-type domain-containing protein n=1 Tax=Chrysodeixis includens TaxID=689277 RepID=A0A9N8PYB6_CHRIL|nr:unnamed protein product [Chrysodeixis includens]